MFVWNLINSIGVGATLLGILWTIIHSCIDSKKKIDFIAEIVKSPTHENTEIQKSIEEAQPPYFNLFIINCGSPISILSLYLKEGRDSPKVHLTKLPYRLERGEILTLTQSDLPDPINFNSIADENRKFYLLDASGSEYKMRREKRRQNRDQPDITKRSQ